MVVAVRVVLPYFHNKLASVNQRLDEGWDDTASEDLTLFRPDEIVFVWRLAVWLRRTTQGIATSEYVVAVSK